MWNLIVSVSDHCLSFYLEKLRGNLFFGTIQKDLISSVIKDWDTT